MRARIFAEENKKWWTLGAVSFGLFMIMLDNTIVNVALPSIQRELHIGISELEWVVNGYALTFAVLMLTGGKLADLFGRRFIFIVGLVIFTGASLACGLAPSANFLIGARVVQGVGSALMNPATLSIITATFPPRQRGMAIGIWAGVSALALAIGPLVGGLITQHISWGWIFFINVPVGILAIVVARFVIKESRDTSAEQRLDLPGLLTSAIGLFALIYALIEANTYGWTSARILGFFALAVIGLVAFVVLELRQRVPMLDLSLFRNPIFAGANAIMLLVALAMFGVFFYVSLYVQNVLGYSPTQAGATFLPMTLCIVFLAPIAGRFTDRYGPRWLIAAGMTLVAGSLVIFAQLDLNSTFWNIFPGLLIGGAGMAMAMAPTTATAMHAVPVDKAGVGSAVLNSMRQVGGSLGIALMGAIVASYVHSPATDPRALGEFVQGFQRALLVAAGIAFTAAVVAVTTLRKPQHAEEPVQHVSEVAA
ncbi:MAG: MFS transporter [Actinomycetota bacterium]|nr:MFS transporter [Actinomycetota bacterium]